MRPLDRPAALVGAILLSGLCSMSSGVRGEGALAVSSSDVTRFGLSVDEPLSGLAEDKALAQCGPGCKVAYRFSQGCASYAAGRSANGWMQAYTPEEASFGALQSCKGYGSDCAVRVTRCEGHEQKPGDAERMRIASERLAKRTPDALLATPPRSVHKIELTRDFILPTGTRVIRLVEQEQQRYATYDLPRERTEWVKIYGPECVSYANHVARWTLASPPCNAGPRTVPVPAAKLAPSGEFLDPPTNTKPILMLTTPVTWSYQEFSGLIDPGAKLYRDEDQSRAPADAGYLWPKEQHYTWFYVAPQACVTLGKTFDCSQPIALADNAWTALSPAEVAQAIAPVATVASNQWNLGGVRTGMSGSEVQSILNAAGYKLTIYRSSYRYADPVTSNWQQDTSSSTLALIVATAAANGPDQPEDTLTVGFTPIPNSEQVYAVSRVVSFTRTASRATLLEPLRKAALEKFGTPLLDNLGGASGSYAMYWSDSGGLAALKPWVNEPDLPMVAIQCQQQAAPGGGAGVSYLHLSPLEQGVGIDPSAVRSHCGTRFISARLSLAPTSAGIQSWQGGQTSSRSTAWINKDAQVMQYFVSLYDANIAEAGSVALRSAEARLRQEAAAQQTQAASQTKPRL